MHINVGLLLLIEIYEPKEDNFIADAAVLLVSY